MSSVSKMKIFNPKSNEFALLPLDSYQRVLAFTSGGKDSLAMVLNLLELGVPPHKIELHHHLVDGDKDLFMDWPVTRDYCRKVADTFGMRYSESWREGGFRAEMLRENALTLPVAFIDEQGKRKEVGGVSGRPNTRRKFPQVSKDLSVRWCSSSLKIDVGNAFIRHTPRFQVGKTLVLSGERADESPGRKRYAECEMHVTGRSAVYETDTSGNKVRVGHKRSALRHVDHWRPVHKWSEADVWEIIKRHGVMPHPAYFLGFNRCSCSKCIFLRPNSLATLAQIDPDGLKEIDNYEKEFGCTIDIKERKSVLERASEGVATNYDPAMAKLAMSETFDLPIITENWQLPAGAFSTNDGPT